ncbi:MAG: sigma-70 family RNA polymerase sigma factor [Oscillospiraceae bacterium]
MAENINDAKLSDDEFYQMQKKYKETGDVRIRNNLVMQYSYIPKMAAMQMRSLAASYAQVDDMINQGMLALIDSVERFDYNKGIKFEAYAFMRVKGSIIDLIRKQDWIPRRVRTTKKEISNTISQLSNELGREPTDEEIAAKMGITVEKLAKYYEEIAGGVVFSFEELIQNVAQMGNVFDSAVNDDITPEKRILKQELRELIKEALDSLPERDRLVVTLYYYENLTLSEIAQVLDVTIQRVSQINSRAILKIKNKLKDYMEI